MTVAPPELSGGGESSPAVRSSVESNFRELDDAFLQNQTRIWLGEVLQKRFDEETNISDILANGELLLELSEVLARMSPSLFVDATRSKSNESKTLTSKKSTLRYKPYYNVGSFLEMCMTLGVDGIDLFSASDVVEKRNTRKVCMCLRSLSMKARSKALNVPDFDVVTRTKSMPTDMVECIRKSLEMSQYSSCLSHGDEVDSPSRNKYSKRISGPASGLSNGSSSDICDDADSSSAVGNSKEHRDYNCEAESPNRSSLEAVEGYDLAVQLNVRGLENEEDDQCLSPSIAESVGSPCSQYFSDHEVNMPSSDCFGSHISGEVESNSEVKPNCANGDSLHVPIDWVAGHSDFADHSDHCESREETDCACQQVKETDIAFLDGCFSAENIVYGVNGENSTNPSEVECEKNTSVELVSRRNSISLDGRDIGEADEYVSKNDFDSSGFHMSSIVDPHADSEARHPLVADTASFGKDEDLCLQAQQSPSCNGENHVSQLCTEVVNDGENNWSDSLNNINTNLEDHPGEIRLEEELSSSELDSPLPGCKSVDLLAAKSNGVDDNCISPKSVDESESSRQLLVSIDALVAAENDTSLPGNDKKESSAYINTSDLKEELLDHDFTGVDASRSSEMAHLNGNASFTMDLSEDSTACSENVSSCENNSGKPITVDDASSLIDTQLQVESHGNMDCTDLEHLELAESLEKENSKHINQEAPSQEIQHKPQRKLLKSVVKGTALVGIAVFLLHLRKSKQENVPAKAKKQPVEDLKRSTRTPPSTKGQKGGNTTSNVYPAEKLKFGI